MKKLIELKDLNTRDEVVLARLVDKSWIVSVCKVWKYERVLFIDKQNRVFPYTEFSYSRKGVDINGHQLIEMLVFDSIDDCKNWCDFENRINSGYYDCKCDTYTELPLGETE